MPRITKATRTSLPVSSNDYNFNEDFRSYVNGHQYLSKDKLILWSSFPALSGILPVIGIPIVGLAVEVGVDQSTSTAYSNHKVYTPAGVGFSSRRYENNFSFCGTKGFFSYEAESIAADGSGLKYSSPMSLLLPDHDDLSFGSSGVDKPFTISFWIYSKQNPGLFNINEGGVDAAGNPKPTFIEKYQEYSLRLDTNGRLRMTLYSGGALADYIYAETQTSAFLDNTWNNIVITYDGSKSPSGIKIYRNGELIKDPARDTTVGSYGGMANTSATFTLGKASPQNPEKLTSMPGLTGGGLKIAPVFVAELSIWGIDLSEESVKAVYHATTTCATSDVAQESGYTTEPPRLRIRSMDCATGSYPTVDRVGDRDFRGNSNVSFSDLNTLVYGSKIVDEFDAIFPREAFSKRINDRKWTFTEGMEIRQEILAGAGGSTFSDGVLVFKGAGERFIQTKRRVLNTSLKIELIQGPHNLAANIIGQGLQLESPSLTEQLKIQYSVSGGAGTWTTVRTITPAPVAVFYGIDGIDPTVTLASGNSTRLRKKIDIHFSKFNTHGQPYYLRIVQEASAVTDDDKTVWGLARIEIDEINQKVRYPLLVDHDSAAGRRVASDAIQTPHTRSDLVAVGRTLPHASDHYRRFTPGENISPFNEHLAIEDLDPTNLFYAIGSSPSDGIPGFSSRLADKTKLTINLLQDGSTRIGHTATSPVTGSYLLIDTKEITLKQRSTEYKTDHKIMALYNNAAKTYSRRGIPPLISSNATYGDTLESYSEDFVHLGFGPIDIVASRSVQTSILGFNSTVITEQYGKNVMSNMVRPVKTFGFPFSNKYEMLSDQTIHVSDYISKPFLLEKVAVDFRASFEFASASSNAQGAFGLPQSRLVEPIQGPSTTVTEQGHRVFIPTFFIINQFKDSFTAKYSVQTEDVENGIRKSFLSYENNVSQRARELVTYGQMTLFASSSDGIDVDLTKALDDGLRRDLLVDILKINGQTNLNLKSGIVGGDSIQPITGNFRLEFPCRVSPKTGFNQRIIIASASVAGRYYESGFNSEPLGIFMSDQSGGRNYDRGLERGNRGLINNYPGLTPGDTYKTFASVTSSLPITLNSVSSETIDQPSPYLLFPGDELIFGWQYPVNTKIALTTPQSGSDSRRNTMTIIGDTKVHLYGSLVRDGLEHHEYSNQPLTSDAIHEVIGAETPIDEFQIATRGELAGSYIDRWICFEEVFNNPSFGMPDITIHSDAPVLRTSRVGSLALSIAKREHNDLELLNPGSGALALAARAIARDVVSQLSEEDQVQRFTRLKNGDLAYLDGIIKFGSIFPNSSYGTFQNYMGLSGSIKTLGYDSIARPWLTDDSIQIKLVPARPKYYFNYRHFGYLSDKIQQGKDGKMWKYVGPVAQAPIGQTPQDADTYDVSDQNTGPVVVQFVSSSFTRTLSTVIFTGATYAAITSGSSAIHKMYNSDIFSTSSVPFIDHERTLIFNETTR